MAAELKRVRSPNYPQIGLPIAISLLTKLWGKIHKHSASRDDVLKALGYKGYNGASAGILSALLKYGLLSRDGESYRISAIGRKILTPSDDAERVEGIRESANHPPLFNQLVTQFDGEVPSNDDLIRTALLKKDFAPNAIGQVIQSFRETFDLVERETEAYHHSAQQNGEEDAMALELVSRPEARARPQAAYHALSAAAETPDGERELLYGPITRSSSYRLLVSGGVGPKELGKLIRLLKLHMELMADDNGDGEDRGEEEGLEQAAEQ